MLCVRDDANERLNIVLTHIRINLIGSCLSNFNITALENVPTSISSFPMRRRCCVLRVLLYYSVRVPNKAHASKQHTTITQTTTPARCRHRICEENTHTHSHFTTHSLRRVRLPHIGNILVRTRVVFSITPEHARRCYRVRTQQHNACMLSTSQRRLRRCIVVVCMQVTAKLQSRSLC